MDNTAMENTTGMPLSEEAVEEKLRENEEEAVLQVRNLHTSFFTDSGEVQAVNGVSFNLTKGKILGVVGESGSGKSVTAYSIMQILADTGRVVEGEILYKGENILNWNKHQMEHFRGEKCSIIFQDPMTSLNPTFTVGWQLREALQLHTKYKTKEEANRRSVELLKMVGVNEPESRVKQYPFELSGGMRQRVMIAMALACEPDILIADEPTTALDVTIQAQILDLMKELQQELGMAIILVTHDLGVIATMCDEIIVMYGGRVCERGTADDIFYRPAHEYTKGLLRSIPNINDMNEKLKPIGGTPINMLALPEGCAFCPRCENALKVCLTQKPKEIQMPDGHFASCWMNVRKLFDEGKYEEAEAAMPDGFDPSQEPGKPGLSGSKTVDPKGKKKRKNKKAEVKS
jgi:oligopeptide transport system ATP-binding protein